jgi:biotin transport system substrate-specific component
MMIAITAQEHSFARVIALSGASLMAAVATGLLSLVEIPIPGTPVPLTLQTFALLAGAGLLTGGWALQMAAWYLLIGCAGAPFFAGGTGGLAHLAGPSGGYLIGFFIASGLVGFFSGGSVSRLRSAFVFIGAALCVYVPGLLQLKLVMGVSWPRAFAMGCAPFIAGDIAKALAAWGGVTISRHWFAKGAPR